MGRKRQFLPPTYGGRMKSVIIVITFPFFVLGLACIIAGIVLAYPYCSALGWSRIFKISVGD